MIYDQKVVVDEVSGWLTVYSDGTVDRTWKGPNEFKFITDRAKPHDEFINGVALKAVTIDETHKVMIYLPEKNLEDLNKFPVVIHFHGGGFCVSEADWYMYYYFYSRFARSVRAIVVSPFLRQAPEHRLPTAMDDAYSSLLWLKSLAKGDSHQPWLEEHADFSRVFLIGDSSGGCVVHDVAARAGKTDLTPLKLAGAIPIQPSFVRSYRSKSELEKPQSPLLTLDMVDKLLGFALPVGSNKDHPLTCPMGSAAPPLESLNLPPYLLCLADMDLMLDTEMEFYEAMKKANKEIELLVSAGMTHGFYVNSVAVEMDPSTAEQTQNLITGIKQFIAKH